MSRLFTERKIERLFYNCDFSKMADEVADHEELFAAGEEYDFRQDFSGSPFKDSPMIPCRMTYDLIDMAGEKPTEEELIEHLKTKGLVTTHALDTEHYDEMVEVYSAVQWLSQAMRSEQIGRVMVARLVSNGHVKPHCDGGAYYDFYDRFHICLSGAGCYFRVGRETVKMLPGEVYWFRNNDEHEVWNDTDTPRDHVIVDLKLKGDKNVHRTGDQVTAIH